MIIAHQTDRRHRFDAGVFMERMAGRCACCHIYRVISIDLCYLLAIPLCFPALQTTFAQ